MSKMLFKEIIKKEIVNDNALSFCNCGKPNKLSFCNCGKPNKINNSKTLNLSDIYSSKGKTHLERLKENKNQIYLEI